MKHRILSALVSGFAAVILSGCMGDGELEGPATEYDTSRLYYLPYAKDTAWGVVQTYDGSYSHAGEYSVDFKMPIGTHVLASRAGTVTRVVDVHTDTCPGVDGCQNNVVYIEHDDGSEGRYLHIDTGGACVSVGQRVERGDVIALSGDIGISMLPHLHFQVANTATTPTFVDVDEGGTGIPSSSITLAPRYTSANAVNVNHCGF